jgi:hypothetical protein
VKITLSDGSQVISPKDRDGFLADLEARLRKQNAVYVNGEPSPLTYMVYTSPRVRIGEPEQI